MRISWSTAGLVVILLLSFLIMVTVSLQESAIMDELAHIPASYGYVKFLDYRLNPEHPPLVKMISALPLAFMHLNFPTDKAAWRDDVNGQWAAGTQFLYQSGNDADKIIQRARVGPMILTLILIAFVYLWSKELVGTVWAFLPTILTAFSPTILAHGHYLTTDIGAALGIIVALYFFTRFLAHSSRKNLILAGLAFGFAQLLKFSAVILIPFFIVLAAIFYGAIGFRHWRRGWRILRSLILIFLIGLVLIYPFYFITTINYPPERQIRDTDFILNSFAGGPTQAGEICKPIRCLADLDIWAANKPLIRPLAQYVLGILMVIQRSAGGNTVYFLGKVSSSGSPLYFPLVYLMKETVAVLILLMTAIGFGGYRLAQAIRRKRFNFSGYLQTHLAESSIFFFVLFYSLYSITSSLNIGVRHLLPIIPLLYILTASGLKSLTQNNLLVGRKWKLAFIGLLMLFFLASVGRSYPYYLSYFNEVIGINNGWRYVTDSNYDWGQDLKRLGVFTEKERVDKMAVDYFGGGSPSYYLGEKAVLWQSSKGNPRESGIKWLAVSINTLQGAKGKLHGGEIRDPEKEYGWLTNYEEPYSRAGKSIFIYKL